MPSMENEPAERLTEIDEPIYGNQRTARMIVEQESRIIELEAEVERLRAEVGGMWEDAISIVESTWATTSVGKVKMEYQSEYERNRVVEALRARAAKPEEKSK